MKLNQRLVRSHSGKTVRRSQDGYENGYEYEYEYEYENGYILEYCTSMSVLRSIMTWAVCVWRVWRVRVWGARVLSIIVVWVRTRSMSMSMAIYEYDWVWVRYGYEEYEYKYGHVYMSMRMSTSKTMRGRRSAEAFDVASAYKIPNPKYDTHVYFKGKQARREHPQHRSEQTAIVSACVQHSTIAKVTFSTPWSGRVPREGRRGVRGQYLRPKGAKENALSTGITTSPKQLKLTLENLYS